MTEQSERDAGPAILIAVSAAIAGYIPAVAFWAAAMHWIRPQQHPEEAMGRGLEAIFIGGPVGALVLAVAAGWLTWRFGRGLTAGQAAFTLILAVVAALFTSHYAMR